MDVFQANDSFQFNKLQLSPPQHITGGSYLTRYSYCNSKQPLYIQTTKTLSKQGIVVSGKKAHIDLVLTSTDADTELLEWMTSLEKRSIELLYEKRHIWFTQELDQTDIENSLASPLRAYKNGNYLLRVNLEPNRHITANVTPFLCKVFDEHKKATTVEYIKAEHSIISIVEFQGIKFTSRNFQIELLLRQVLVIQDIPLFETCLIRDDAPSNAVNVSHSDIPERDPEPEHEPEPEPEREPEREPEPERNKDLGLVEQDETEKYTSPQPLKHFEYTEVDIDFKNIPDVIDVNEPVFDVPSSSSATAAAATAVMPPSNIPKSITLKKHKDVLYEMYKIAKHKACEMKRAAMRAYLEAKEIKAKYLLDDLDDLDSESSDDDTKN
jgi:hypothetical protein